MLLILNYMNKGMPFLKLFFKHTSIYADVLFPPSELGCIYD